MVESTSVSLVFCLYTYDRHHHVESHCLMISGRLWSSQLFQNFWDKYQMSDSRDTTVEIGEKALSQMIIHSEFEFDALLSREKLVALLSDLDDGALLAAAQNIVHHLRDAHEEVDEILEKAGSDDGWRNELVDWIYDELSHSLQHLMSVAFMHSAMTHGGMGFMKKARDKRFHNARKKLLAMADAGEVPPLHPAVRAEIEAAIETWGPPLNWRLKPEEAEQERTAEIDGPYVNWIDKRRKSYQPGLQQLPD